MGQQHARRGDVHNGDAFFGCNGLENVLAVWRPRRDLGSLAGSIPRIQNVHGNILLDGREHSGRVQHLRAEVGQFRRLIEADHANPVRIRAKIRIGGHHSVHISMASAFNPAPTIAAEKSEPPRPIVVVTPLRVAPMNPPITGTRPPSTSGFNLRLSCSLVSSKSGTARMCVLSVTMHCRESTSDAFSPRAENASLTILLESNSP